MTKVFRHFPVNLNAPKCIRISIRVGLTFLISCLRVREWMKAEDSSSHALLNSPHFLPFTTSRSVIYFVLSFLLLRYWRRKLNPSSRASFAMLLKNNFIVPRRERNARSHRRVFFFINGLWKKAFRRAHVSKASFRYYRIGYSHAALRLVEIIFPIMEKRDMNVGVRLSNVYYFWTSPAVNGLFLWEEGFTGA